MATNNPIDANFLGPSQTLEVLIISDVPLSALVVSDFTTGGSTTHHILISSLAYSTGPYALQPVDVLPLSASHLSALLSWTSVVARISVDAVSAHTLAHGLGVNVTDIEDGPDDLDFCFGLTESPLLTFENVSFTACVRSQTSAVSLFFSGSSLSAALRCSGALSLTSANQEVAILCDLEIIFVFPESFGFPLQAFFLSPTGRFPNVVWIDTGVES